MTQQNNPCQHIQLATSPIGDVKYCADCGIVHLAVQNLSLRLETESFRALTYMLAQAQLNMEDHEHYSRHQYQAVKNVKPFIKKTH